MDFMDYLNFLFVVIAWPSNSSDATSFHKTGKSASVGFHVLAFSEPIKISYLNQFVYLA